MNRSASSTMVADAYAFYSFGWMLGTSGNLSVRMDDSFLITASGKDKGRLTEADFLLCHLDGTPTDPSSPERPSAETAVHSAIYRALPDAGAVYHVHEPYAALCSDRDERRGSTAFVDVEMIKGLNLWDVDEIEVPIVPNHRDIAQLAVDVDAALGGRAPAVNILRHGFYAWGASAFEAKRHVESLAYLYRYSWERGAS